MKRVYFLFFASLLFLGINGQTTEQLYQKADSFALKFGSKYYYGVEEIQNIEGTDLFWYKTNTPNGKEFLLINPIKKVTIPAFNQEKLAEALAKFSNKSVDTYKLSIYALKFNKAVDTLYFKSENFEYICSLSNYSLTRNESKKQNTEYWGKVDREDSKKEVKSPDGNFAAYIQNENLWIRNLKTTEQKQLSFDGSPAAYYSSSIYWSPDNSKIVCCRYSPVEIRKLLLIDSSPDDQLQPKKQEFDYPKPGDALPVRRPVLFDLKNSRVFEIKVPAVDSLFDLNRIKWNSDSKEFSFHCNKRGHQNYSIYAVNAENGKLRTLVNENSETFIYYNNLYDYTIERRNEMLWISERNGWRHLYMYNTKTGEVLSQLTKGEWIVKRVLKVDEKERTVLFVGCGRTKGEDPYLEKLYSLHMDTKVLHELTPENANHTVTLGKKWMVDYYSRADKAPELVVRKIKDGQKIYKPENQPDISKVLAEGWRMPEVFCAKGRDGITDIWGMIIRPTDFDPNKKYPVIEYIYAGPHDSFVPKNFAISGRTSGLSEIGFITVLIDGMGTANRSKAFHDVCWKNLKDAGFPDRIAWIKAAGAKYPEMDLDRIGIYGGSAGGQSSTGALLFHPEFYKVAVSSCGCHDNRMDKIWWNEQWMGYPVGKEYAASSNVENAEKLQGKLMLILGELDNNVDPSSTLQLVDKLVKYNKDFEFVMLPGAGHTLGDQYGERKRRDYFLRWLKAEK